MVDFKLDLNTPVVPVQAAGADPKPSYGVDLNSPVNVPADLEEQAKQPQYSVFGTPLPGSLAERTGRPQHPLSKAVSQNFDLTDGIKGDDLAINEAIADTFGFNYVEEDAGDGTIRKVKKYNSVTPEMVGTMDPGVRESMKQRQDVKKTMEAVSITRSRLAKDAESVAILRGEINMLYAAEGAMNTFKRIKNGYEFDAMSEALGAAPEKLGMILGLVSAGARGGKNRDSAFAVAEGLAALASGGTEEDMQKAAVFFKQAWDYAKRAEGMPRSEAADEFLRAFATIDNVGTPEGFLKAAKIFATNLYGAASTIQEIVAEQAGPLIAQIGARLIAGPAGGAIVSAGTNYAQEQFGFTPEARDNIKKKFGYDLTTEKGISSFVRDTKAVDAFIEFGAKRGVIIAALDLVGLGVLRAFSRTNLNRLSKIAVGTFSEATTSFTGESLASIWSGQGFKLSDSLLESMAGAHPVSVGIEAYTAGAADYRDFTHSKQAKEWLKSGEATRDTIAGLPAEKLARASDVLADKLKSDGIDTVYIKADELLKFDQDGSAADTLGLTSEAVQSAAAEGQDVAIDAATYIRHILGKDGFDALMRHTRFDIAGMTAEEADNYTALGIGDQIEQALQDKALARIAPSIDKTQLAKLNEDLDLIKSTVSDMLAATGQYEGRKADLFAQLTAQRYASRAIRMTEETGKPIDALALFDADNLRIQGSDTRTGVARSPEFARLLEQQAFNQKFVGTGTVKVTPAEQAFFDEVLGNEVNRAELLEAVPSLAVKDGSLSVAAEDIDAFLSAMNDFVISDGAISVPPRLRALTSSRDIVSKMEFNQTAKEFNVTPEQLKAELEAAGGDITQTPAFKAWFGDSKVVDADGKPLVVYHGTIAQWVAFEPTQIKSIFNRGTFDPNDNRILYQDAPSADDIAARLDDRAPPKIPSGATYMGVGEQYTVENTNADAPRRRANSSLIQTSTNAGNAAAQTAALDALFERHPEPLSSEQAWVDLANDAFSLDRVPMPPWRTLELVQQGSSAIASEISGLNEGMKRNAEEGLKTAREFGELYANGEATPDITAKAFLWSFLSRGVSPYVQEGAFLDAIGSPILTDLMQRAAREGWSTELDEAYSAWAADAIPPGSPGRGTQHNLNAFGRQFLRTMTQLSPGTNQTGLEIIHGMIADGTPSKDIRREFLRVGAGAGIDNKVVSFTLLLLGRTDVLVLDRVQVRNQFNDGRFDGENIYDTEVNADGKQVTGTAFAEMTFGHKGLLYYEAMEAALQPIVEQAYDSLGMEGSLGRYHWDSWLLASNQEVGHASVEGLLRDAQGKAAPYAGAFVRQGKYNNYDYGFRYGTVNDGSPVVLVEKLDLSGQAVIVPHALMADSKSDMRKAINKLKTTAKKRGDQYGVTIPWTAALTEEERGEYDAAVQRAGTLAPDVWAYDANAVGRENATGTIDPEEGVQEGQAQKEVGDVAPTPVGTPTSFAEDQMFQGEAKAPRGSFAPSDLINDQDGNPVNLIQIFEGADPSTFLHESGHFWLEMLKADAQSVGGQFQKDWSIVNDWWGLRSLEIKDEAIRRAKKKKDKAALAVLEKMTDAQVKAYIRKGDLRGFSDPAARFLSVSMHEQFARGTEEYFRTARAPSIGLASLFNSFRVWIGSVYRGMLGMDVSFSPEVREVLDRMIASDEEIEAANGQFEMAALFDDASQAGMSKEEFSNYHKGVEEGRNQSKANQLAKHMRQMRTEKTVLWEEQREAMRPEVTSEIANQRAFKLVFGITQGGLADGSTLQDGERIPRINGTVLKALMEEEGLSLKDLPRVGGKAIYSMSTKEGETSDPGAAAAAYGYDDVITMIAELTELNSFPDAVNVAIDERMKKEHGSIDDTGDQEAIASIHGDHIAKVMAAELQALRTSEPAFKPAFIRQYAADKISNMKTGEIKHHLFTAAERRHAKLAKQAIKSGDKATAYKHQFQRLVNHRLAEASLKARSDIDKKQTYLKKFGNKKKKFESVAPGYISTIRTIIEATDFRTPISERARLKAELQAINAFVEKAKNNDGAVLEMPAWLVERDALTNVRDMTYQEFLEMHESVSSLERQGKLAKKIRSGMEYRDRQEVIGEMIETLSGRDVTRVNKINDQWADKPEGMSAIYASGLELLAVADAQLLKVEFLLEALDGKPLGPWHQALYQPFAAAAVARNELSATASKLIADGFKSLPKAIRQNMGRRVDVGGLGTPGMKMTRGQLIMLALNTGNESNLDKVIRGFGGDKKSNVRGAGWNINEDLISKALDQLSAEEWKFIQSIWDHAEILWPDVARIYEAENGVAPERVEPRVIKTKHGDFSGGYFPLQYDHRRPYDASSSRMEQKNALEMMQSSVGRASVNSSMTKGRTGYAAPIKLDIEDLARTFDNSIHFITHYDAVRNAKKIITDPDLRFELENVVGKEYAKELDNWVAALANNNQPASPANFVERTGNWLMKNTTMAVLGASYTTLAAQSLGLTVGLDALVADQKTYGPIEITVAAADLAYGLSLSLSPAHYKSVMQASPFMRFRRENYDREVKQVLKASKGRIVGSLTTIKERTITEWGMQAIAEAQFFSVDLPVWTASYNRALRADPGDERGAIAYADRTVRRSQSSGDLIDLSAVQRQGKLTKLFTMFYTFFSALYAILRGVGGDLMKNASTSPASAISRAATRAFVLLTLQAVGTGLIRGELPDLEPEDEDAEGLLGYLAKETALSALGTVPFVRDLSTGALKGYGYSMSPAGIFGDAFVKSVAAVDKLTTEGFIEDAEYTALVRQLKPLILLGGTLTGVPSVQINRSLDGAAAYFDESYGWHWSDSIRGYDPKRADRRN
jgi:hypothetical protein